MFPVQDVQYSRRVLTRIGVYRRKRRQLEHPAASGSEGREQKPPHVQNEHEQKVTHASLLSEQSGTPNSTLDAGTAPVQAQSFSLRNPLRNFPPGSYRCSSCLNSDSFS